MGVLMSLISICFIFYDRVPLLGLLLIIALVAGPILIYRLQRKYFIEQAGQVSYSTLWLYGILMVVCGALISGLVTLLMLQYVRPTWIYDMVQTTIDSWKQMPAAYQASMKPMLEEMKHMIDAGLLPTSVDFVIQMFWNVCLSGVLLTSVTSAFAARATGIRH